MSGQLPESEDRATSLVCQERSGDHVRAAEPGASPASFCVLARTDYDWSRFEADGRWHPATVDLTRPAWTDDYSTLLPYVNWQQPDN